MWSFEAINSSVFAILTEKIKFYRCKICSSSDSSDVMVLERTTGHLTLDGQRACCRSRTKPVLFAVALWMWRQYILVHVSTAGKAWQAGELSFIGQSSIHEGIFFLQLYTEKFLSDKSQRQSFIFK